MKYPIIAPLVLSRDDVGAYEAVDVTRECFTFGDVAAMLSMYLDGETDPYSLGYDPGDITETLEELNEVGLLRMSRFGWSREQKAFTYWLKRPSVRRRAHAKGFSKWLLALVLPSILIFLLGHYHIMHSICWMGGETLGLVLGLVTGVIFHECCHHNVGLSLKHLAAQVGVGVSLTGFVTFFPNKKKDPLKDAWLFLSGCAGNIVLAAAFMLPVFIPDPWSRGPAWMFFIASETNLALAAVNLLIGMGSDGQQALSSLVGIDVGNAWTNVIERKCDLDVWVASLIVVLSQYLFSSMLITYVLWGWILKWIA